MSVQSFTPAAGNPKWTKYYDTIIALLTREKRWRSEAVSQLALKSVTYSSMSVVAQRL